MPIINSTPGSITECRLHQRLTALSRPSDGLANQTELLIRAVAPLLDLVQAGPFREYTLHDHRHPIKLIHLADHLIEDSTFLALTPLDLTLFISSAYLHDLAMCLTSSEKEKIIASPSFQEELQSWPALWEDLSRTREALAICGDAERLMLETRLFQLHEAGLASYLRSRHAHPSEYERLIRSLKDSTGRNDLFSFMGVSYEHELIEICASHNEPAACLLQGTGVHEDRFPRTLSIAGMRTNTQFCAALLRLTDILDFDRERTPPILFESLGIQSRELPGSSVTLKEWSKHMAVHTLEISPEELIISGDSTHPAIEHAVREFAAQIEQEIRDTLAVIRKNPPSVLQNYNLSVPTSVRAQIRSVGYAYHDLSFRLDESSITRLLMGEALYPDRTVGLRELVQNAIDACQARKLVQAQGYKPQITVYSEVDQSGRTWLVVEDDGIGMDEKVLTDYFFRLGESYYTSREFLAISSNKGPFAPISRFGIGILSVFMIGDQLFVRTRNGFSPRGDFTTREITVDSRFGLAFIQESKTEGQGTTVKVRIKERERAKAIAVLHAGGQGLRRVLRRPYVPVRVEIADVQFQARPKEFITLADGAAELLEMKGVVPVLLDVSRWSAQLTGRIIVFFFRPSYGKKLFLRRGDVSMHQLSRLIDRYSGNTVTVNGILMHVKQLERVFGSKLRKLMGVVDIDIAGNSEIEYDVARQRLVGDSVNLIRAELRKVLKDGLEDLGIASRITYHMYRRGQFRRFLRNESELLAQVQKFLPDTSPEEWSSDLHKQISKNLGISTAIAFNAVCRLAEARTRSKNMEGAL